MTLHKILFADDDKLTWNIVVRDLRKHGFDVTPVMNGEDAVQIEETLRPDLVILDVEMPVMDGFEACKIIRKKRQGLDYVPIIFLSGLISEEIIVTGLEIGGDEFITKPFDSNELVARINNLLKMRDFIAQVELLENTIFSLVKSVEARDFYTAGHSRRVSQIATYIGSEMGLPEDDLIILRKGALLHDIGKLGVPDQILNKPGKCSTEEFNAIQKHPVRGEEICRNLRLDPRVRTIIRSHHEKLDGSGYPDHLKADEISVLVRIITIADIFDALTTSRPYRTTASQEVEAIAILQQEAKAGKIDPAIVGVVAKLFLSGHAETGAGTAPA